MAAGFDMLIRPYRPPDEEAVVALWRRCNLTRPQNDPRLDIQRKLEVNPDLFLVGEVDSEVVATVMAGYDGHRGWVNYLGIDPGLQRKGLGSLLMKAAEERLRSLGCPKINLQVRKDNLQAVAFYDSIGYSEDAVVSMGRRLVPDQPAGWRQP
jgi:ribosomal protein S18 acetylase RimI-like enzyme